MTAYGVAHLYDPKLNEDVPEYVDRIQATMDPFGGRFLVHGPDVRVVEGEWPGTIVIIEFPDLDAARGWYESGDYAPLRELRRSASTTDIVVVEGV